MKEAVLPHDLSFFGIGVNPSFYSALIVTGVLLFVALILRIFVIPRFKIVPGKFQVVLETIVGFFSSMADQNSPHRNRYIGAYVFSAGLFIFTGTMIELVGLRAVLVDINACIALALMSFGSILAGGFYVNKFKGLLGTLKDFSLPISMSFRLFGSMLGGLLVTELVYQFLALSFVVPVFIGVIFTIFHAVIQSYILPLLTTMFYGESTIPKLKNTKSKRKLKNAI